MMEYPKINSLWKRKGYYFDDTKKTDKAFHASKKCLILGDYACEEFGNVKKWRVDEKIDGTNIRIFYQDGKVSFGGRTKDAQLPPHLLAYLQAHITKAKLEAHFGHEELIAEFPRVILFGEGYGPKIQACGGDYRNDPGFILFDAYCEGWWLKREDVKMIAESLQVPIVPDLGFMTEPEIVEFVQCKPLSRISRIPMMMEGVVCRSDPLLLFRNGKPLMFKLKCRDFPEEMAIQ